MKVILINRDTNENVIFEDVEMVNIFNDFFNRQLIYVITKKQCHKYTLNEWEVVVK